jgi:tetratricopeptide (TPR) repeat protein
MNKQKKIDLTIIFLVIFIPFLFSMYFATVNVNKETKKSEFDTALKQARSSYNSDYFDKAIDNSYKVLDNLSSDEFPEQYIEAKMIIGDSYYSLSKNNNNSELNLNNSLDAYKNALNISSNNPKATKYDLTYSHVSDAYRDIGAVYQKKGKYVEAINAYDNAIEINPQNSDVWIFKATCLEHLGNYNEAEKAYDKALEINPQKIIASFSITHTKGNAPLTVTFTDLSKGSRLYRWWSFGDGTVSSSNNDTVNHTYFKAGKYKVFLQVANAKNSYKSEYKYITVNETVRPVHQKADAQTKIHTGTPVVKLDISPNPCINTTNFIIKSSTPLKSAVCLVTPDGFESESVELNSKDGINWMGGYTIKHGKHFYVEALCTDIYGNTSSAFDELTVDNSMPDFIIDINPKTIDTGELEIEITPSNALKNSPTVSISANKTVEAIYKSYSDGTYYYEAEIVPDLNEGEHEVSVSGTSLDSSHVKGSNTFVVIHSS